MSTISMVRCRSTRPLSTGVATAATCRPLLVPSPFMQACLIPRVFRRTASVWCVSGRPISRKPSLPMSRSAMAKEDLTDFLAENGIKVRYLHSDIDTVERVEIIRDLRLGEFDVLVGINLLREGLDIPEVSLVAILDADKEGFLRSERSLIQTTGRAARNINGRAILYADKITDS